MSEDREKSWAVFAYLIAVVGLVAVITYNASTSSREPRLVQEKRELRETYEQCRASARAAGWLAQDLVVRTRSSGMLACRIANLTSADMTLDAYLTAQMRYEAAYAELDAALSGLDRTVDPELRSAERSRVIHELFPAQHDHILHLRTCVEELRTELLSQ